MYGEEVVKEEIHETEETADDRTLLEIVGESSLIYPYY